MNVIKMQQHWIDAIVQNDESVLQELYVTNYPKVEVFVLKNNGTVSQAKDIYQESFIALWQNVKNQKFVPQNESALQGYLYQIAKNKWIDYLRSSRFKNTSSLENHYDPSVETEDHLEEIPQKEFQLKQLSKGFSKLGQECKELLKAFYFEKKSLRIIAKELSIGEASARNKKYRCIVKLKTLIAP